MYIIPVSLLCWLFCYFQAIGFPVYSETTSTPLWSAICPKLTSPEIAYSVGFLVMLGGAFMVHRVNYSLGLIREKTLLPVWLFMLLCSTNPGFFPLQSASPGIFCMVVALYWLFTSYHRPQTQTRAFMVAFMLGVGSLLWVYILWFLPLFWYGMYKFRSLNPKTFCASLLGIITIYWFVLAWCVYLGDFQAFQLPFQALIRIHPISIDDYSWKEWLYMLYTLLLICISGLHLLTHEHEESRRNRQFLSFLLFFCIWTLFLFVLYRQSAEEYWEMLCLPASILIAHFFTLVKGKYSVWGLRITVPVYFIFLLIQLWSF